MILPGIEYQRPTSLNMRIMADHVTYSFLAFMKSIFHFCLGCYCGGYSQNGRSNLSSSLSCQGPSSWGTGGAGSLPVTSVPWEDGAFLLSFSYTWSGEVPRGWHSPWLWWERPLGRWLHWIWWFPQGIFRVQSWTQLWGWRVVGFATSPSSHTTPGG